MNQTDPLRPSSFSIEYLSLLDILKNHLKQASDGKSVLQDSPDSYNNDLLFLLRVN